MLEISKTYLQTQGRGIPFAALEIESINQWVSDLASELSPDIQCQTLERDQSFYTDPFWLRYVLSSLAQNALIHGKAPVRLRLHIVQSKLRITVEDQGECEFGSFQEMSDAFVKSRRSKGMGLGLNIVSWIMQEWGSQIEYSPSPTSFSFSLSDQRTT